LWFVWIPFLHTSVEKCLFLFGLWRGGPLWWEDEKRLLDEWNRGRLWLWNGPEVLTGLKRHGSPTKTWSATGGVVLGVSPSPTPFLNVRTNNVRVWVDQICSICILLREKSWGFMHYQCIKNP